MKTITDKVEKMTWEEIKKLPYDTFMNLAEQIQEKFDNSDQPYSTKENMIMDRYWDNKINESYE